MRYTIFWPVCGVERGFDPPGSGQCDRVIEKFSAVCDITVPMWRNQFAIPLSLSDQRNASDLANAIDDASNVLMRKTPT